MNNRIHTKNEKREAIRRYLKHREDSDIASETEPGADITGDQLQATYRTFQERPKTRMEAANDVGIDRANVCWFVRDFRKRDQVAVVKKGICPITKYPGVEFLTTDPEMVKKINGNQTELFT